MPWYNKKGERRDVQQTYSGNYSTTKPGWLGSKPAAKLSSTKEKAEKKLRDKGFKKYKG